MDFVYEVFNFYVEITNGLTQPTFGFFPYLVAIKKLRIVEEPVIIIGVRLRIANKIILQSCQRCLEP